MRQHILQVTAIATILLASCGKAIIKDRTPKTIVTELNMTVKAGETVELALPSTNNNYIITQESRFGASSNVNGNIYSITAPSTLPEAINPEEIILTEMESQPIKECGTNGIAPGGCMGGNSNGGGNCNMSGSRKTINQVKITVNYLKSIRK